jgi:voltage-gated potassium channel
VRKRRSESEFDAWLTATSDRADPFMAWLGVLFALLVGFEVSAEPGPEASRWLMIAGWSIWALFAAELAVDLWLAPSRLRFLRRRWWQVLLLAVPFLRVLRFVRLLRLGRALPASRVVSSSYRAAGTARFLLRSRLAYLGGLGSIMAIAAAQLAYLFERDRPDAVFETFGDALLWSFATVIALQGDPVPESVGGRVVMLFAFVVGLVVIASLAGVIGAFLVDERRERAAADEPA